MSYRHPKIAIINPEDIESDFWLNQVNSSDPVPYGNAPELPHDLSLSQDEISDMIGKALSSQFFDTKPAPTLSPSSVQASAIDEVLKRATTYDAPDAEQSFEPTKPSLFSASKPKTGGVFDVDTTPLASEMKTNRRGVLGRLIGKFGLRRQVITPNFGPAQKVDADIIFTVIDNKPNKLSIRKKRIIGAIGALVTVATLSGAALFASSRSDDSEATSRHREAVTTTTMYTDTTLNTIVNNESIPTSTTVASQTTSSVRTEIGTAEVAYPPQEIMKAWSMDHPNSDIMQALQNLGKATPEQFARVVAYEKQQACNGVYDIATANIWLGSSSC